MKRIFCLVLCLLLLLCVLPSCQKKEGDTLRVVCTVYPIYDWATELLRGVEGVETVLLVKNGTDVHSYQPSVADVAAVTDADLLLRVGGASEKWIDDVSRPRDAKELRLLEELDGRAVKEEHAEGMEHDRHGDENAYDEHIWLSLKNALLCVKAIEDSLVSFLPEDRARIGENAEAYEEKLSALDEDYQGAVEQAGCRTLVFADRFPFRYLVEDYGLEYYAAFSGCSTENEASFETVCFLADKLLELDASFVFVLEDGNRQLAESVIRQSGAESVEILTLDSMQSYTEAEGVPSYLAVMEENLRVLMCALGGE